MEVSPSVRRNVMQQELCCFTNWLGTAKSSGERMQVKGGYVWSHGMQCGQKGIKFLWFLSSFFLQPRRLQGEIH
jgi:hypothetical protein